MVFGPGDDGAGGGCGGSGAQREDRRRRTNQMADVTQGIRERRGETASRGITEDDFGTAGAALG